MPRLPVSRGRSDRVFSSAPRRYSKREHQSFNHHALTTEPATTSAHRAACPRNLREILCHNVSGSSNTLPFRPPRTNRASSAGRKYGRGKCPIGSINGKLLDRAVVITMRVIERLVVHARPTRPTPTAQSAPILTPRAARKTAHQRALLCTKSPPNAPKSASLTP